MKAAFVGGIADGQELDVRFDIDSTGIVGVRQPRCFKIEDFGRPITPDWPRPEPIHWYRRVYLTIHRFIMVHQDLTDEQGIRAWHESLSSRAAVHRG